MAMRFEAPQVEEQFHTAFGHPITPEMLSWVVKVAKHVRTRCRSNAALRNYLQKSFPGLLIGEVEREWKGKTYMALTISERPKIAAKSPAPKPVVVDDGEGDE